MLDPASLWISEDPRGRPGASGGLAVGAVWPSAGAGGGKAVGGGAGGGRVEDALDRPVCARDGVVVTDKRVLFVTGGITGGADAYG